MTYDICVIGSGAGASPIIYEMTKAGYNVAVLEKGEIYTEKDFSKDELTVRRDVYTPPLKDEYHVIEEKIDGQWYQFPTYETGWNFWNGSILGGSSNFMSGYFYRLKPNDFKLKSTYGNYKGDNSVDWPISYDDMEKYYDKVEKVVGVSGVVSKHPHLEPRSSETFPYPALQEHPITKKIDAACEKLGFNSVRTPRAIISTNKDKRNTCYYSNYCGSYPCASGAKGSGRASLIQPIIGSKNLTIIANALVYELVTDENNQIKEARYINKKSEKKKSIKAKVFVLAAQAIESSRLLLNSKSKNFPNGLANNSGNVGKNFLSTGGGMGIGTFDASSMDLKELMIPGLFVNRSLKDWYFTKKFKGGTVDFLFEHANPIRRANPMKWGNNGLLIGKELQDKIFSEFTTKKKLRFEIFTDWIPNDDCYIFTQEKYKDKYGIPVANIRIGSHPQNEKVGKFLAEKSVAVLEEMGAKDIETDISPLPSQNLQAGGCRFGDNPKTSVLNKNCQAHEVNNLFVTDGSFMPTGGSVPYTFTIYANSFRVADYLKEYMKQI